MEIRQDLDFIPPKLHPGRPKGSGKYQRLLNQLTPGDPRSCLWGVRRSLGMRIVKSAVQSKIKVKYRTLEDGTLVIWRMS